MKGFGDFDGEKRSIRNKIKSKHTNGYFCFTIENQAFVCFLFGKNVKYKISYSEYFRNIFRFKSPFYNSEKKTSLFEKIWYNICNV